MSKAIKEAKKDDTTSSNNGTIIKNAEQEQTKLAHSHIHVDGMNRTMELIQNLYEEIDSLEKDLHFDTVSAEGAKKKCRLETLKSALDSTYVQMSNFN